MAVSQPIRPANPGRKYVDQAPIISPFSYTEVVIPFHFHRTVSYFFFLSEWNVGLTNRNGGKKTRIFIIPLKMIDMSPERNVMLVFMM